jgi:peptide/nickel transport system permease protein
MATDSLVTPNRSTAKAAPARKRGQSRFSILRNGKIVAGLAILGFFVLTAVVGPWLAPYDPSATSPDVLQSPSPSHLFGTTALGEDVFSQVVAGTRLSLLVGLVAAAVGEIIAVTIGVTSAFAGGIVDEVLTLLTNIFLVIPVLPLQILIIAYIGNGGWVLLAAVIALTTGSHGARKLRAQTLAVRHRDYIEAARANGEPWLRTVFAELLPNLSAVVITSFVFHVTAAIVVQTGLAFLGLGDISQWSWGAILHWSEEGSAFLLGAWWWFVPPGL